jgi:tetratricopeptide (TPR) repeat protein
MIRQLCRSWDLPQFDFSPFVTAARRILENNADHTGALNMIVICDEDQDQKTKMKMALRCVELEPQVADYQYQLCLTYADEGDRISALKHLGQAIKLLPYSHWFQLRANLKMSYGPENFRPNNVSQDVQRFLAFVPSDCCGIAESYYALGLLSSLENVTDKAVALYLKSLEAADPSVRLPCFDDGNYHSVKEL